jgi:hypothetical protein
VLFPPEVVVLAAEVQVAVVARLLLIRRALPVAQATLVRSPTSWAPTAMQAWKAVPPPTLVIPFS